MSTTPTIPSKPVLLAVALALLGFAQSLGPINTANPANALTQVILYLVAGGLLIATQYAPAQLRSITGTNLISGSAILGIGLFLIGQATMQLSSGNLPLAGVFFIGGAIAIIIGVLFPSGFLHKALRDFQSGQEL